MGSGEAGARSCGEGRDAANPGRRRGPGPDPILLTQDALKGLDGGSLFYPAAWRDRAVPLQAFRPWIRDFWFVDIGYQLDRRFGFGAVPTEVDFDEFTGTTLKSGEPYSVRVRHEHYRPRRGSEYTIHVCRGRGYDAFRSLFRIPGRSFSVFFHRGDSEGEGGSNFWWLRRRRLANILEHLEPGGLIVSDGSLASSQFDHTTVPQSFEDLAAIEPFELLGRRFRCVGYLGYRYGPTLAWKVTER